MKTPSRLNAVSVMLLILLIVGGWALYAFIPAYYSKARISVILGDAIASNFRKPDEEMIRFVSERLAKIPPVSFQDSDIIVERLDEKKQIRVKVFYRYIIDIPFSDKTIELPLSVEDSKDISLREALQ